MIVKNYIESTVYCVNVSNCSTLLSEDDILNFPKNTTESLYYKTDQVYDVLKQITDTLTSRSGKVVKGVYKGDISVFRSERMFPNISQFHTTVDRDMYIKNCLQELFYIFENISSCCRRKLDSSTVFSIPNRDI